jgi:hypothetical protein
VFFCIELEFFLPRIFFLGAAMRAN